MSVPKVAIGAFSIVLLLTSGCAVVQGRVTDGLTGMPVEDVQAGLIVYRWGFSEIFEEFTRSDKDGFYAFSSFPSSAVVTLRKEGYVSAYQELENRTNAPWNVSLQPLAPIGGTWNVTITSDSLRVPETQFTFSEDKMVWREGDDYLGPVKYTFDGETIRIDDYLGEDDLFYGSMAAEMHLNAAGDTLTGSIEFSSTELSDLVCNGPCVDNLVAVRVGP